MTSLRSRLPALMVVISLMMAAAGSAFTQPVRHACPPDGHLCCHGPRLMACCPADDETPAPASTPAASRVDVNPVAAPILPMSVAPSPLAGLTATLRDAANRSPGRDLPTLLGTLRI